MLATFERALLDEYFLNDMSKTTNASFYGFDRGFLKY